MTIKNPAKWTPQPFGYGYVTQVASNVLTTNAGAFLVDNTGKVLATTTALVTGKNKAVWSDTGA